MKRTLKPFGLGLLCCAGLFVGGKASAQVVLPIEYRVVSPEGETWINLQSQRGVPISATPGNGSDGRMPLDNESTSVFVPPTAGQFRGLLSYGAVPGLTESDWRGGRKSGGVEGGGPPVFRG
ncbi:MAG TPA: hypothetical protein PKE47_04160, partial [Verrucomicrobiota bacterium]|nr:hypothetical protein [Verrucomicrobiota bacterium]